MGYDGEKGGLPRVVRDAIHFLRETGERHYLRRSGRYAEALSGMQEEGLFRRSPNSVLLRQVTEAYDRGQ